MRNGLIGALDVGSTKVCCFVARMQDDGTPKIVGIGHQVARGVRGGAVVDMEELEHSIRATVDAAEKMAEERIGAVLVNISGGSPTSANVRVEVAMNGHAVDESDIRRMLDHGRSHGDSTERNLIHAIPVDYTIDGNDGIRDPRGMYGERLGVRLHMISAASGAVRNLTTVIHRCQLEIEARVVSPFASGLACVVDDEKELGVTCIDMGGGTTSLSVFVGGKLVYTDVIPVGGYHVTNDIARGLSTPLTYAERIKTLYGSAMPSSADDREMLKTPLVGEDEDGASNQVPRSMLVQIIRPRLEETFELVRSRLEAGGFDKLAGRRVVLTGGASQMQGARDLCNLILDKQVRPGRPLGLQGLPDASGGPAFSVCAGLIRYALAHAPPPRGRRANADPSGSSWGKMTRWFKDNF